MKTLEFLYQETQIHFLVNPLDKNVMVNATEMAKLFGKRTDVYLKTQSTKEFIKALEQTPFGGSSETKKAPNSAQIIDNRGHMGIYFDRRLALDFAAWLDVNFRVWVYSTIDEIVFGNYKKHWEAHAMQEIARVAMEDIKTEILHNPTPESVAEYFKYEREYKNAKNAKTKAIRNQLKLFGND